MTRVEVRRMTGCGALLQEAFGGGGEEFPGLALLGSGEAEESSLHSPGLAEQGLILTAAGMAYGGKRVVASASASLLAGRAYEQIRSAVALPALPVCLVGCDSGLGAGYAGGMRQMFEDIALMRSLPNMAVLVPADGNSAVALLREASRGELLPMSDWGTRRRCLVFRTLRRRACVSEAYGYCVRGRTLPCARVVSWSARP